MIASTTRFSSVRVSTSTREAGASSVSRSIACTPELLASLMSISTTSGRHTEHEFNRVFSVGGFADELEPGSGERPGEGAANQRLVVDQHDRDRRSAVSARSTLIRPLRRALQIVPRLKLPVLRSFARGSAAAG